MKLEIYDNANNTLLKVFTIKNESLSSALTNAENHLKGLIGYEKGCYTIVQKEKSRVFNVFNL